MNFFKKKRERNVDQNDQFGLANKFVKQCTVDPSASFSF